MKLRPIVTSFLSNVVADLVVFLLGPTLAVASAVIGLRPIVDLEGQPQPIPVRIDPDLLVGFQPGSRPPRSPLPEDRCAGHESPRDCWLAELETTDQAVIRPKRRCEDDDGDQGVFDVVIFSDSYSWALGKADEIELNDVPAKFRDLIETTSFVSYLEEAPVIYAVGTASCEGYEFDKQKQIDLARARANLLKKTIQDERDAERRATRPTKELCLGVYAGGCRGAADTRYQRRLILMALFEQSPDLDEEDCIRHLFSKDRQLSYLAEGYEPGFSAANPGLTCR